MEIVPIIQANNNFLSDYFSQSKGLNLGPDHLDLDLDLQTNKNSFVLGYKNINTSTNFLANSNDFEPDDISQSIFSIQKLLLKYRMYSKSNEAVVSGGLQQFITRKIKERSEGNSAFQNISNRLRALYKRDNDVIQFQRGCEEHEICFIQHLPVDLKLHIFSYLDVRSLCKACCVNRDWSNLTNDEHLWKRLLHVDSQIWSQVSYLTNPKMYKAINSEWTNKEIYLKCSPEVQKSYHHANSTFNQVSSVLKALLPKKVPKVAMFGPGLEQSTSGLVRQMLYTENDLFARTAMFPGQDGVGGGITLKLLSGHSLHLSVLYTASREERENRVEGDRLQGNRLLQRQVGQEEEDSFTLNPLIRQFCQTVDAFIFVIDASQTKESIAQGRRELMLMLRERTSSPHIPVLILSCIKQNNMSRVSAYEIVELLHLTDMTYPWLIIDCESESLRAVDTGIVWLVEQAQNR